MVFSDTWKTEKNLSLSTIKERVEKATHFRVHVRGQSVPNSKAEIQGIEKAIDKFNLEVHFPEERVSRRRRMAFLRVARTIADLDASTEIKLEHLEKSVLFTQKPFFDLKHLAY